MDPEFIFAALPKNQQQEIDEFAESVVVPGSPYGIDSAPGADYLKWYKRGHAFVFLTGVMYLPDYFKRETDLENAKMRGWFDGSSSGQIARLQRLLERSSETR